ncbi:hypothetical protein HDC37_003054 [Microbacterium sp. AK009]|uniref:hypothetical protein n=1 Tax=Microbacterium sp. AK009 TaxID=2723068 RepID=UPI0015CC4749|nr:hypothetical protein [Microbacterium sp. AK009]NYF18198.1 hypothetical protein [Microbacterium sp. AK009]
MTTTYALLPADATAEELSAAGVDPEAKREVPGLGYIHSGAVAVWVGVEPVDGTISLNGATLSAGRGWERRGADNASEWVNNSRLVVVRLT